MRRVGPSLFVVGLAALPACLIEYPPAPQCLVSDDCQNGQVCVDRLCYGNPPDLTMAAELVPPAGSSAQPHTEIGAFLQGASGAYFVADFKPTFQVDGRVVLASDPSTTVGAQVIVRWAASTPGLPTMSVTATSVAGVTGMEPSFSLTLPEARRADPFTMSIFPTDATAELASPLRLDYDFSQVTATVVFPLGGGQVRKLLAGRVVAGPGVDVEGYTVRAYGRFSAAPSDQVELASSRGRTAVDGSYQVYVPIDWLDTFELRFEPPDAARPRLVLKDVEAPDDPGATTDIVVPVPDLTVPDFPAPQPELFVLRAPAPEGGSTPARDARLNLTTYLQQDDELEVVWQVEGRADAEGLVSVLAIPGTTLEPRAYLYQVTPLIDSPYGHVLDGTIQVGPAGSETELPHLPARVGLHGRLMGQDGNPQRGVIVSVEPSLRYRFQLLAARGVSLDGLAWPATLTDDDGRFLVWVDEEHYDLAAAYEVSFRPPEGGAQPRWSVREVIIAGGVSKSQDIGEEFLPAASLLLGTTRDPMGTRVPGATLRVWELVEDSSLCDMFPEVSPCQIPAVLRAETVATDAVVGGNLRLVLPRP